MYFEPVDAAVVSAAAVAAAFAAAAVFSAVFAAAPAVVVVTVSLLAMSFAEPARKFIISLIELLY